MGAVHGVEQRSGVRQTRRVGVQNERLMLGAESAGALTVRDADAGVAQRRRQHDERRHPGDARTTLPRQYRAIMRMLLTAAEQMAGLHHLLAGFVDRRFFVMHRAHQSVTPGALGHPREMLADSDAGDTGLNRSKGAADRVRRIGLGIPGIDLTGTADEEEEDTVDVLVRRPCTQVRQRQPYRACAKSANTQKIPPRQSVAGLDTLFAC